MPGQSRNTSQEPPREIYVAACEQIADALRADHFTYAKSRSTLYRKSLDRNFVFQIAFQSSHHNSAGKSVALWLHGYVFSPALKSWRVTNQCLHEQSDFVAGGQIGNLIDPPSWMEWNLAQKSTRTDQITSAIAAIKSIAYPYFAMFDDKETLISRLPGRNIPGFSPADIIDFLMCFGLRADVSSVAQSMLAHLPGASERYPIALAQYRNEGLPPYSPTNHGEVLAVATIIYNLSLHAV